MQLQHVNAILPLFQPHSRTKQIVLWTCVPVSAQQLSVHPHVPLPELRKLKESVSGLGESKFTTEQPGEARFFIDLAPVQRGSGVEGEAVGLPGEGSSVFSLTIKQALAVEALHLSVIDVPHRLDEHPQHAAAILALHFHRPVLVDLPLDSPHQLPVDEQLRVVMGHQLEAVGLLGGQKSLVDYDSLVVHPEGVALEEVEASQGNWGGQVRHERGLQLEGNGRNGDGLDGGRKQSIAGDLVFLEEPLCLCELSIGRALLVDGGVVVVGSDVGLVVLVFELVGSGCEREVRASVDHIEAERELVAEKGLDVAGKGLNLELLEILLPPVREPPRVDLSAHHQPIFQELYLRQRLIFLYIVSSAEAEREARIILLFPERVPVLIVEVDGDVEAHPHTVQLPSVPPLPAQRGELILDLQHDDVSSVDVQVRADHFGQRREIDPDLSVVCRVITADHQALHPQEPRRQASEIPLRADVGPGPQHYLKAMLLAELQEAHQVALACGEVKLATLDLVQVPKDVHAECVEAQGFDAEQAVFPVFPGNAREVDFPRVDRREFHDVVDLDVVGFNPFLVPSFDGVLDGGVALYAGHFWHFFQRQADWREFVDRCGVIDWFLQGGWYWRLLVDCGAEDGYSQEEHEQEAKTIALSIDIYVLLLHFIDL